MSFCRNCGNEVNEKAVGCPKCGFDPKTEKNFCYECGSQINEKQVICVSCGVSLEKQPQKKVQKSVDLKSSPQKSETHTKGLFKRKSFNFFLILLILGVGMYAYFSWASHLRKGKVEELITAQYLPRFIVRDIQYGLIDFAWNAEALERVKRLAEKGFFTCEKQEGYDSDYVYLIDITKEGKKHLVYTKNENQNATYYSIEVAKYAFGEVTNIEESEDGESAKATYTLKIIENTLFDAMDLIGETGNIKREKEELIGTYAELFYKKDGEWKIGKKPYNFDDATKEVIKWIGW